MGLEGSLVTAHRKQESIVCNLKRQIVRRLERARTGKKDEMEGEKTFQVTD